MIPTSNDKMLVSLPPEELETLLSRAAKKGAQLALADVGLDGPHAEEDIRELRSLLQALNLAKRTAWQTFIRVLTAGVLAVLMAGIAMKFKIFEGP